jgi:membrane protein implicated in regulation of membrane protease activity
MPEFGMVSIGALAAAVTAGVTDNLALQVIVFCVVSTALVLAVRPIARRSRAQLPGVSTGIEALKGRSAVVVERVDGSRGQIKLAGEVWSARSLDTGETFEPGREVSVVEIDGATAVVM